MLDSEPTTKQDVGEAAVDVVLYECKASPDLIAAFEKRAIKVVCSEDQVLFSNGEPGRCVYLVLAGEVGLSLSLTSMDGMGFRAQPGSFVGLPAAFSNEPYSMTAVARKGAELAMMGRDKFCDLVATSPMLSLDVLKSWQQRRGRQESQLWRPALDLVEAVPRAETAM